MDLIKIYILDIVLALIFLFNVVYYCKKGFVRSLLEFFSFFAAAIITKVFSPVVSEYLIKNTELFTDFREYKINLLSIVVLFVAASIILKFLIKAVDRVFKLPVLKTANKFLGLVLGALTGVLIIMAFTVGFKIVALSGYEPVVTAISNSKIIAEMSEIIAKVFPAIAGYIQGGLN